MRYWNQRLRRTRHNEGIEVNRDITAGLKCHRQPRLNSDVRGGLARLYQCPQSVLLHCLSHNPKIMNVVNPLYAETPKKWNFVTRKWEPNTRYVDNDEGCSFCFEAPVDGKVYFLLHYCNHFYCRRCTREPKLVVCGGCNRPVDRDEYGRAVPFRALVKGQVIELNETEVKVEIKTED